MTRPAPLEVYVFHPEGSRDHHATLYDPATGAVLMTAQELGYQNALDKLLLFKACSKVRRRRYVVKTHRPAAVLGLLELSDMAESEFDADSDQDATFLPLSLADVRARLQQAIHAIERSHA